MNKPVFYQDATFRKIAVSSTGLGIAFLLGTLAAIGMHNGGGFQFGWRWPILAVVALGVLWNWRFWNLVWARIDQPEKKSVRPIVLHVVMLLLIGVGSFLYPLRFVAGANWFNLSKGLVTAILFLGTCVFFIFKFGKMFVEMDEVELKIQSEKPALEVSPHQN